MKRIDFFALVTALGMFGAWAGDATLERSYGQSPARQAAAATAARTLPGQGRAVEAIAFSPDGRTLASGGSYPTKGDGLVRLWDLERGALTRVLSPARTKFPFDEVHSLVFSPDGRRIAVGGGVLYHGAVAVWDLSGGKELWQVWDVAPVASVPIAFAPDGRTLANGGGELRGAPALVELRDADTGKVVRTFRGGERTIAGLAFSPDGKTLAAGDWGGAVRLWDVASDELKRTWRLNPDAKADGASLVYVAFSPDGRLVAAGGRDQPVRLWDAKTGASVRTITQGSKDRNVRALAFSPDGKTLAVGSWRAGVTLFDTATGAERTTVLPKEGREEAFAFSGDGKSLAVGGVDGSIRIVPLTEVP